MNEIHNIDIAIYISSYADTDSVLVEHLNWLVPCIDQKDILQ